MKTILLSLFVSLVSQSLFALEFESLTFSVWKKGETYYGHELVPANEAVADTLAALPRPSDPMKALKVQCQIKVKDYQLRVTESGSSSTMTYADIIMVYDLKDCKTAD